jgi:RNA polymerase sigma factor (sigma-70 family)
VTGWRYNLHIVRSTQENRISNQGIFLFFLFMSLYATQSDDQLISLYKRESDIAVVGELYSRYLSLVYGLCLKYLKDREASKDATMQIFERLGSLLHQHEVITFKSWLYVVAKNHCLMHLRASKKMQVVEFLPNVMEKELRAHQEDDFDVEQHLTGLEQCLETLVTEQKQCFELFYLHQKSYKEIQTTTGFDDKKVKSYIQNGKRNLKICMEQRG